MAPIRLGFIGLSTQGWASTNLVPPLFDSLLSDKYILTALCTSNEASANAAAAKFSALAGHPVKAYHGEEGYKQIASDPDVDMVAVSIRMPDHYKAIMPAIEAGKHIFVEWSPGKNLDQTLKIAEAAKAKGIRSFVGLQAIQGSTAKKLKQLVDAGKIGRVLSTTLSMTLPLIYCAGKTVATNFAYTCDATNGATLLTIVFSHHYIVLNYILGDLAEVAAFGAIRFPEPIVVDAEGNPTGQTVQKNTQDQVIIAGSFGGKYDGVVMNLHFRSGPPKPNLHWVIDGEDGTIEIMPRPENGPLGVCMPVSEMKILLNGEEVELDTLEEDRLGVAGKSWFEFAKGDQGHFVDLEHAAKIYKVVDAAITSLDEGRIIRIKY